MIGQPERLLATILLGNNIVNAATTAVITATVVAFVGGEQRTCGRNPRGRCHCYRDKHNRARSVWRNNTEDDSG